MVEQNDSIIELSTLDATRPMHPSRPASRSRCCFHWLSLVSSPSRSSGSGSVQLVSCRRSEPWAMASTTR